MDWILTQWMPVVATAVIECLLCVESHTKYFTFTAHVPSQQACIFWGCFSDAERDQVWGMKGPGGLVLRGGSGVDLSVAATNGAINCQLRLVK